MNEELKAILDTTNMLFDLIDKKADVMKKAGATGKLSDVLKMDIVNFLMQLSAVDGRISRVEAQVIRDYFEIEVYPIHIKKALDKDNISPEKFAKEVPVIIKVAVDIDNFLFDEDKDLNMKLSEAVLEIFKVFGKELIVADEKVKEEEKLLWVAYITTIAEYMQNNLKKNIIEKIKIEKPGNPIDIKFDMSLETVGRVYTIFKGKL